MGRVGAARLARRRRRSLAHAGGRAHRPPAPRCSARRSSRPGCACRAATPSSGCGRSPTAAGAPSSRSPTTRRCPIACAFTRPDVLTTRPPTDVPIQGIDLPAARRSCCRSATARRSASPWPTTAGGPGRCRPVCRAPRRRRAGWVALTERAEPPRPARRAPRRGGRRRPLRRAARRTADAGRRSRRLPARRRRARAHGRARPRPTSPPLAPEVAAAVHDDRQPPGLGRRRRARRRGASCWPPAGERRAVADLGPDRGPPAGRRARAARTPTASAPWRPSSGTLAARPGAVPRRHPRLVARRRPRGPRAPGRAGVDGVVRRALARRAPGRAVGGRRRPRRAHGPRRRPDLAHPSHAAARRSGAHAADVVPQLFASGQTCRSANSSGSDQPCRGGQRRAKSTRRWAKSPVDRGAGEQAAVEERAEDEVDEEVDVGVGGQLAPLDAPLEDRADRRLPARAGTRRGHGAAGRRSSWPRSGGGGRPTPARRRSARRGRRRRRAGRRGRCPCRAPGSACRRPQGVEDERLLGRPPAVDRRLADAGPLGQDVHRQPGHAGVDEQVERRRSRIASSASARRGRPRWPRPASVRSRDAVRRAGHRSAATDGDADGRRVGRRLRRRRRRRAGRGPGPAGSARRRTPRRG